MTQAYHEDIQIAGSDITLHYNSRYTTGYDDPYINVSASPIAGGWSFNVWHRFDGEKLYRGDGIVATDINVSMNGTETIIKEDGFAYIFDANLNHTATRLLEDGTLFYAFTYGVNGTLQSISDAFDNNITIHYNATGTPDLLTASTGRQTALQVDANDTLQSVAYEDGSAYTFVYDDNALMLSEFEPEGNEFKHIFDAAGRITKVIDDEGGEWGYGSKKMVMYDEQVIYYPENERTVYRNYPPSNGFWRSIAIYANGDRTVVKTSEDQRTVIRKQCGLTVREHYNESNPLSGEKRLTKVTSAMPSGLKKTTKYNYNDVLNGDGKLQRSRMVIRENGAKSISITDWTTHTAKLITPERRKMIVTFDESMRLPLTVNPTGLIATHYTYDAKGRVVSQKQGNRETLYAYNAAGNLESVTDPLGRMTHYAYDKRDRLSGIAYPDGQSTYFAYDANGNMKRLTTPTPAGFEWDYNGVNRATLWRSPLGFETLYNYDKQRRLTQIERPSGKTITNIYANAQQIGTTTPETTYDYVYGCGNKVQGIQTNHGESMMLTYDGELMTSVTQSGTLNQTVGYSYNSDFLPDGITYAGGTETLEYDKDGLPIQIGEAVITRNAQTGFAETINDDTYAQTNTHNGYGETQSEKTSVASEDVYRYEITDRLSNGRIHKKKETIGGETHEYRYNYDNRGRLTQVAKDKKVVEQYNGLKSQDSFSSQFIFT